jgi:hypothetical protein
MNNAGEHVFIPSSHPLLQFCGRFADEKDPVEFIYPCSYVKIKFKGTSAKALIRNKRLFHENSIGVLLDGEHVKKVLPNNSGISLIPLASNLSDAQHELTLYKRMGGGSHYFDFFGFSLGLGSDILPPQKLPYRKIEVYGDSISAGEVSEALDYAGKQDPLHNGEYSNGFFSYAQILADKLGAQLHNNSQGGLALLSGTGYFHSPESIGLVDTYSKLRFNPDLGEVTSWDFTKFQPHYAIIAIGQNDAYPENYMAEDFSGEKSKRWRKCYKELVESIREKHPDAHIILMTTILEHDASWDKAIKTVCDEIKDNKTRHFLFKKNGSGTPGHVRKPEAEIMADELFFFLNSLEKT